MPDKPILRWETKGKKYWLELYKDRKGRYYYRGDHMGGNLGTMNQLEALKYMDKYASDFRMDGINLALVAQPGLPRIKSESTLKKTSSHSSDNNRITIRGKVYQKVAYAHTRKEADTGADIWRTRGYNTRVIAAASTPGFNLYARKKNG